MTDNNDFSSKNEDTFYDNKKEKNIEKNEEDKEKEKTGEEAFKLLKKGTNKETIYLKIKGKETFKALKNGNIEKFKKIIEKNGFPMLIYRPNNGNKTIFNIAEEMGLKKKL